MSDASTSRSFSSTAVEDVRRDLKAQQEIGVPIPPSAFDYVEAHQDEIVQYREGGMKIADIADHVAAMARTR